MRNFLQKVMDKKASMLTYEEILRFPVGASSQINEGVTIERLPTFNNVIFFRVEMLGGSEIHAGIHDCYEDIILYYGDVIETRSGKRLIPYNHFTIKNNVPHAFKAREKSVFYAYLYKKPKIK